MKKFVFILAVTAALFVSCGSTPDVKRVDSSTAVDLDGFWNDTDVKIVCETMISECIASPRVASFEDKNGRAPVVIIGKIKNQSSEHIDTSIVEKKFQTAILNSGVLEFVSNAEERIELRQEKADQAEHASYDTAKEMDNETGADFMLTGSVKSIVQSVEGKQVRTYFVYAELHDIKSNKILWMSENDSIKKIIKRAKSKI